MAFPDQQAFPRRPAGLLERGQSLMRARCPAVPTGSCPDLPPGHLRFAGGLSIAVCTCDFWGTVAVTLTPEGVLSPTSVQPRCSQDPPLDPGQRGHLAAPASGPGSPGAPQPFP